MTRSDASLKIAEILGELTDTDPSWHQQIAFRVALDAQATAKNVLSAPPEQPSMPEHIIEELA